jgi:hypothetical protein
MRTPQPGRVWSQSRTVLPDPRFLIRHEAPPWRQSCGTDPILSQEIAGTFFWIALGRPFAMVS